jgi:hypothetical protein
MKFICFFLLTLIFNTGYSQTEVSKKATQFQIETFGPGSLFSVKFDSRFAKREIGLGFNIGVGGAPLGMLGENCNSGFQLTLPLGLNYLFGMQSHLLELGTGYVPTISGGTKKLCLPEPGSKPDFFSDEMSSYWYILSGYRHQPVSQKGITYRIFISPLLQKDFPVKFWGGGSIGIRL